MAASKDDPLARVIECMEYKADVMLVFDKEGKETGQESCSPPVIGTTSWTQGPATASVYDGHPTASCHANILSMTSLVFRDVIESTSPVAASLFESSSERGSKMVIPLPGTTKEQWMQIAPFLYPPAAVPFEAKVTWDNLEAVLVLGHKYDMKYLFGEGSKFLIANMNSADGTPCSSQYVWKWLRVCACFGLDDLLDKCIARMQFLYNGAAVHEQHLEGLPYEALKRLMLLACRYRV
jgi:hypothetical protein